MELDEIKKEEKDAEKQPIIPIPEVVLSQPGVRIEEKQQRSIPIGSISQLLMFQSGNASTAPTHSPRNFYEQLVIKDSGSVRKMWIWSQQDGNWRYTTLT